MGLVIVIALGIAGSRIVRLVTYRMTARRASENRVFWASVGVSIGLALVSAIWIAEKPWGFAAPFFVYGFSSAGRYRSPDA